ncbi:single-stranded DNA-binding protein [Candidatus Microgenomates bacterium]|nr:single-stranded DNA-binding protein [Candidatus Microgenomates bacterium]
MARSLNKVMLIGNLTRDPELKYTPSGAAVCTFGLATNRQWKTESGDQKDEAEFHKLVSWNQLAEICSKMLKKGIRVYIEGRLQTRSWQGTDGTQKQTTEIVVSDMIILDSRRTEGEVDVPADFGVNDLPEEVGEAKQEKKTTKVKKDEAEEDIPF